MNSVHSRTCFYEIPMPQRTAVGFGGAAPNRLSESFLRFDRDAATKLMRFLCNSAAARLASLWCFAHLQVTAKRRPTVEVRHCFPVPNIPALTTRRENVSASLR